MREDEILIIETLDKLKMDVKTSEAKYIVDTMKTYAGNSFNLVKVHDISAK